MSCSRFFDDTATAEIYTLSLHDALPISGLLGSRLLRGRRGAAGLLGRRLLRGARACGLLRGRLPGRRAGAAGLRSEEHTPELQSRQYLVCRLLLEQKSWPRSSSPTATRR